VNPVLSTALRFCSLTLTTSSNFFIVRKTLIKESGFGVTFNSKFLKNFSLWNVHKLNLFLSKTGNQKVIKSVASFSFNPRIFNFSSRKASAFSSVTTNPSLVS